jgi:hypothetical protein
MTSKRMAHDDLPQKHQASIHGEAGMIVPGKDSHGQTARESTTA